MLTVNWRGQNESTILLCSWHLEMYQQAKVRVPPGKVEGCKMEGRRGRYSPEARLDEEQQWKATKRCKGKMGQRRA